MYSTVCHFIRGPPNYSGSFMSTSLVTSNKLCSITAELGRRVHVSDRWRLKRSQQLRNLSSTTVLHCNTVVPYILMEVNGGRGCTLRAPAGGDLAVCRSFSRSCYGKLGILRILLILQVSTVSSVFILVNTLARFKEADLSCCASRAHAEPSKVPNVMFRQQRKMSSTIGLVFLARNWSKLY